MTTRSYPAVGLGGFTDDDWLNTFGSRDGIAEDYLGTAMSMTLDNTSNTASFTTAKVGVNGFTLVIPANESVSLPAPTSGSKVYYIGAVYDPLLNVADGSGNASPLGPCRLVAYDTTIDTSNGKRFLICYVVTRTAGTALSGSVVEDRRRWVSDVVIEYPDGVGSDSFPGNEGSYPRGTLRKGTNRFLIRTYVNGGLAWVDPLLSGPFAFPASSGLVSNDAAPSAPQYLRYAGSMVTLRGTLKRSTGTLSNGNDVALGTLPGGFRPPFTHRFGCIISGNRTTEVRVGSNGVITMTNPSASCTWIDLSAISFRAEL